MHWFASFFRLFPRITGKNKINLYYYNLFGGRNEMLKKDSPVAKVKNERSGGNCTG
jgi:hypothetical protein